MKLLIIEGQDRCGKDSLINAISEMYPNVIKRHWSFPKGDTNEDKTQYQKTSFHWEFENYAINKARRYQENTLMIWNRAHLGEMVYGSLYRNSEPHNWVMQLEDEYKFSSDPDVYLVYLYADPEFIVSKDDGESYSAKLDDKRAEMEVFMKAFDSSQIVNKLKIKVNSGDSYLPKEDILKCVNNFLNPRTDLQLCKCGKPATIRIIVNSGEDESYLFHCGDEICKKQILNTLLNE